MKNYLIASGLVALLVSGLVAVVTPRTVQIERLSAVSSPDILSPYFSFGGLRHWAGHRSTMASATTTVCSIQAPAATSTLMLGSANFAIASSSATIITFARSTSPSASTTLLASSALGASAQGTMIVMATSTALGLDSHLVFPPNTYFNVSVQAGDIGGMTGLAPTGSCAAEWVQLAGY